MTVTVKQQDRAMSEINKDTENVLLLQSKPGEVVRTRKSTKDTRTRVC